MMLKMISLEGRRLEKEVNFNDEVDDLKKKYNSLVKKIDAIEKESKNTENSIKKIENSVGTMNNNFEALMNKLDNIVEDKEASKMFKKEKKSEFSLKNMITRPMRMLAVGTFSTIFTIVDYTSETVSSAREGMEDILAEAQYNRKKRRSNMMPDMDLAATE